MDVCNGRGRVDELVLSRTLDPSQREGAENQLEEVGMRQLSGGTSSTGRMDARVSPCRCRI